VQRLPPVDSAAARCSVLVRPFSPSSARVQNIARVVAGQSTPAATLEGRWSHCDAYLQCPSAWIGAQIVAELWVRGEGVADLVASVDLANAALEQRGGERVGRVCAVRGRPGERFELVLRAPAGPSPIAGTGRVVLEAWGDDAGTTESAAAIPFDGLSLVDAPSPRMALGMVWDDTSGSWHRARQGAPGPATSVASSSAITATTTAQAVAAAGTSSAVMVKAPSTNTTTVYVGGSTVTTADGIPLDAGEFLVLSVADPSLVYCVTASGSPVLRVLVVG